MSWIDRLDTRLLIVTGDGREYNPLWLDANKNINYNVKGFDFVGKEGTFVERKEKSGTQFPLTLFFTGENCIELANNFEVSSRDKRPWRISHPFYNDIVCQPLSMAIDNATYNVSKITCVVWETIETKYPSESESISGKIVEIQEAVNTSSVDVAKENIKSPSTSSIQKLINTANSINAKYREIATTPDELLALKQLANDSFGAINNYVDSVSSTITSINSLINFPFQIIQTTEYKINRMVSLFNGLLGIFAPNSDEEKELYAQTSCGIIAASCSIVAFDSVGYTNRDEVVRVINNISSMYDSALANYDSLSYSQSPDIAIGLDSIVNITLSNLFDIAFNSKQERSIILLKDTNTILLAHKYWNDDLDAFMNYNDIGLSEYLQVKAGRTIKYLV